MKAFELFLSFLVKIVGWLDKKEGDAKENGNNFIQFIRSRLGFASRSTELNKDYRDQVKGKPKEEEKKEK